MYRYGQPPRSSRVSKNQQTILLLVLLALTIVCICLGIVYSSAAKTNDNMHQVLVSRVQSEVSDAKKYAAQLLPTGGSRTESIVAIVRQHVYAVRAINEMTGKIYGLGNVLINETLINNCVQKLDECDAKIQTGAVVTGTYDELSSAIDILYEQVSVLE